MNNREKKGEILERIESRLLAPNKYTPPRIGFGLHDLKEVGVSQNEFEGFLQYFVNNGLIKDFTVWGNGHEYIIGEDEDDGGVVYEDFYVGYYCLFVDPKEFELAYKNYKKNFERRPQAEKEIMQIRLKPTSAWTDVTICFKDKNNIEVEENGKFVGSGNFKNFSCTDHSNPDVQWELFWQISFDRGTFDVRSDDPNKIKKISKLNAVLTKIFNLPKNPINPDPEHPGKYKTAFTMMPIGSLRKEEPWGIKVTEKRFVPKGDILKGVNQL